MEFNEVRQAEWDGVVEAIETCYEMGWSACRPAVTICTDIFTETSRATAATWGAPDYPVLYTRHPISHLNRAQLRQRAEQMLDQIVAILTGAGVIS